MEASARCVCFFLALSGYDFSRIEHLLFCVGLHCSLYLQGVIKDLLLRCYATRGNAAAATSSALGCELSPLLQNLRSLLRRPRSQY